MSIVQELGAASLQKTEVLSNRQNFNFGLVSKRAFDIMFSSVALIFVAPLIVLAAIAIKFDSPGPIFYRQKRYGLNGKIFTIWKLRSMSSALSAAFVQCTANDARVTKIGNLLRRFSIDELPQLMNVLLGDMSIVGPRPHPLNLDQVFSAKIPGYMSRYKVRPGLTGLAQVQGLRGPTPTTEIMGQRVAADLEYAGKASLAYDLLIIMRTFPVLLTSKNAL